jgi:hypothetical protein
MSNKFTNSPFEGQLEVIATLSQSAGLASLAEQAKWENLTRALRQMIDMGISVDELSAASGLSPSAIRDMTKRKERRDEDVLALFGLR